MKSTLVIATHEDDEALGCGGYIAKNYTTTDVLFIAERMYPPSNQLREQRVNNCRAVLNYRSYTRLLEKDEHLSNHIPQIAKQIEFQLSGCNYDTVFIPFWGDNNQDHRAVFEACSISLRRFANKSVTNILCYEIPSSTEQTLSYSSLPFKPNCYLALTEQQILKKTQAFLCYEEEARPSPHPRSIQNIITLAKLRGAECNEEYAESYMSVYQKI